METAIDSYSPHVTEKREIKHLCEYHIRLEFIYVQLPCSILTHKITFQVAVLSLVGGTQNEEEHIAMAAPS